MRSPKSLLVLRIKWRADRLQHFKTKSKKRSAIRLSMGSELRALSPPRLRWLGL
jgi:hypothetical protein